MACHMDLRQWLAAGASVPRDLEMYGFCEAFGYVNKVCLCTDATPHGLEIPFKPKQLKEAERLARHDDGECLETHDRKQHLNVAPSDEATAVAGA